MTTVTNIANARAIRHLHITEPLTAYFPVKEVEIAAINADGIYKSPKHKGILRTDTNELLGIHSNTYKLVKNEEIFPQFESAMKLSSLDLSGMKVTDKLSHGGARTIRSYIFPSQEVNLNPSVGDKVSMELKIINSYDGSTPFVCVVGGNRLACLNGLVVLDTFASTFGKHTSRLDTGDVVKRVNTALDVYMRQVEKWKHWMNVSISSDEARAVFKAMPNHNETLEEKMMLQFADESQELGPTMWALYNSLTYWATHEEVKATSAGNAPAIQLAREHKVRQTMASLPFLQLAA